MHLETKPHSLISPTAKLVAYWRRFTDLPFSQDIAEQFHAEKALHDVFGEYVFDFPRQDFFIPFVELRYRCLEQLIVDGGYEQVLEFASGISLRGLAMTKNPRLCYVETDLPGITEEKVEGVEALRAKYKLPQRSGLHFHSVNVLNYDEIEPVLKHFNPEKPLLILNEGLFQYLPMEEKRIAALNIRRVLMQFKGEWATPDFDTRDQISHIFVGGEEQQREVLNLIDQATGRNFETNAFVTKADAAAFFDALGFEYTERKQWSPGITLSSVAEETTKPEVMEALNKVTVAVLKLKQAAGCC